MTTTPQTQTEWTVHSINIHGIFFERWCQQTVVDAEGWTLDSANYPVEFPPPNGPWRGQESTLDVRASRIVGDIQLCLFIECKKNNPDFVDWVFFNKPAYRSVKKFIVSQLEVTPSNSPAHTWGASLGMRTFDTGFTVADEARETRGNYLELKNSGSKTKTSNAAIQDAAYQVALATQAIAQEDHSVFRQMGRGSSAESLWWRKKVYFPTIVTTAKLFVCDFDPKDVDPTLGEIAFPKASIQESSVVVFEYALPRSLQFGPRDAAGSYKEGRIDLFTRLHIMVVHSEYLPTFLQTFFRHESSLPSTERQTSGK
jgi:hypothetical protein